MGVGSLELESKLTGQNEISCGVGTATINLTGSENDYQVNIDKGLGAANVAGNAVKDGETIGTGKNRRWNWFNNCWFHRRLTDLYTITKRKEDFLFF